MMTNQEREAVFERILTCLAMDNAFKRPSFWTKDNHYQVINTRWNQGYDQALMDIEAEVKKAFMVAEYKEKGE